MSFKTFVASKRFREFAGVLLFGLAVILSMSLLSYDAQDPSYFTYNESPARPHNFAGRLGATLGAALFWGLGLLAYTLPLLAGVVGAVWFAYREWQPVGWRALGYAASLAGGALLLQLFRGTVEIGGAPTAAGGVLGGVLGALLVPHLNVGGAAVVGALAAVLGLLGATRLSLRGSTAAISRRLSSLAARLRLSAQRLREARRKERLRREVVRKHARRRADESRAPEPKKSPSVQPSIATPERKSVERRATKPPAAGADPNLEAVEPGPASAAPRGRKKAGRAALPPLDLLDPPIDGSPVDHQDLQDKARLIVERCAEFDVAGEVVEIHPGPVVTTFEFRPEPGVKYSRVTGLVDDLCLALQAESIRIDRIPGKSTVGIEVPNSRRETIFLREILASPRFQEHPSPLRLGLGKGIDGEVHVADLADMPHLLIAGSTGAGKSVTLNALITSLLYTSSPDQVKFIMVDTKRLELGIYENAPHLITPVVTEARKASNALRWAVLEMEKRYKLLAGISVRNIGQYNKTIQTAAGTSKPRLDDAGEPSKPIPHIVVIIDELADLMLTSAREVEESIMRLAQMARAVGIHLILSTQRPSVDVITGVIKANLPSRMALRVTSKVDSRTILDGNGAEKLLGMGDMLFIPPRSSRLVRIHGAFLSEKEILRVVKYLQEQAEPTYDEAVTADPREETEPGGAEGAHDEMYPQALKVVIESRQASTSALQRRLRLGFARAGRLMDMLEADGIVGPQDGSKAREVLVGPEYLSEFQAERRD